MLGGGGGGVHRHPLPNHLGYSLAMYKCNFFTCSLRNTILALCFPKPICEGVNLSGT